MRLDELRAMLGIKHAQMQRIRKQLGNVHEHRSPKPGQPTWVYAPLWLPARFRLEAPTVLLQGEDDEAVYKRLRREREQFRFDCERREYLPTAEVIQIFDLAAAEIRSTLDDVLDRQSADLVAQRLTQVEQKLLRDVKHTGGTNGKPAV